MPAAKSTDERSGLRDTSMILARDPGARILSVATAFPPQVVDRAASAEILKKLFPAESASFIDGLIERSGVEHRHIAATIEEVLAPSKFGERNRRSANTSVELAERAARTALERSNLDATEIDVLIDVSCTSVAIPALDVHLAPRLGLRSDVRRIPITESGCAAGGLALGLASSFAAHGERVLVVAVELCSLTVGSGERARADLIASVIFGDGAAAAIVAPATHGPRIAAVGSRLVPESSATMGFDVGEHGLRIVLQRELPSILNEHLPAAIDRFLAEHGRSRDDIALHLVHPGGRRILDSYCELFALESDALRASRTALARYGNLSSASILSVLELALDEKLVLPPEKEALVVSVGPGLSLEFLLVDWNGAR